MAGLRAAVAPPSITLMPPPPPLTYIAFEPCFYPTPPLPPPPHLAFYHSLHVFRRAPALHQLFKVLVGEQIGVRATAGGRNPAPATRPAALSPALLGLGGGRILGVYGVRGQGFRALGARVRVRARGRVVVRVWGDVWWSG